MLGPDNDILIKSMTTLYTVLRGDLVLIKAHMPLHRTLQVLLSVKSLIGQIETESYTVRKETEIDPVACLIHLLALLMEVMQNTPSTPPPPHTHTHTQAHKIYIALEPLQLM